MSEHDLAENPFFVLGITPSATRMEVERAGQKLLAQLAIGVAAANSYATPFGKRERDESKVRGALAMLRDPEKRTLYELWYSDDAGSEAARAPLPSWPGALGSIAWRGSCTG